MKIFCAVTVLLLFVFCNPLLDAVTKKVELWICLGPTLHCGAMVPTNKISIDSLDKYFSAEGDKYKIYIDTLVVSQSGHVVTVSVSDNGVKYQEDFYIYNKDIPYIYKIDVLVYLKVNK